MLPGISAVAPSSLLQVITHEKGHCGGNWSAGTPLPGDMTESDHAVRVTLETGERS